MKIFYDEFMPYGEAFFCSLGEAIAFQGRSVTPQQIQPADALAVRSTTCCSAALLDSCRSLRFVGTATAGINHLDIDYLKTRDIRWMNAAGCNAVSVTDWVTSVLLCFAQQDGIDLHGKRLGIVGVGEIGTRVAQRAKDLGLQVLCYDPPRAAVEGTQAFASEEQIFDCDFITLHAPLNHQSEYQNKHFVDFERINALKPDQYLLNAARGELIDNKALLHAFQRGKKLNVALDVWESEPDILWDLVPHLRIATQHIAGHSLEGKARGTEMVYQAMCKLFGKSPSVFLADLLPIRKIAPIDFSQAVSQAQRLEQVLAIYDVRKDDSRFRAQIISPSTFDHYRKTYPVRRELA